MKQNLEHLRDVDSALIGVLADTHLPYRMDRLPDAIRDVFQGVDVILHAGDVDRIRYLQELAALAPLYAVRGNVHLTDWSDGGRDLPSELQLVIARRRVIVTHGGWPHIGSQAGDWLVENLSRPSKHQLNRRIARRLVRGYPHADAILFGHSHAPYRAWHNAALIFNPGAVCPTFGQVPSVGRLYLGPEGITAEVVPLV
jgi:hypothetical protein